MELQEYSTAVGGGTNFQKDLTSNEELVVRTRLAYRNGGRQLADSSSQCDRFIVEILSIEVGCVQ
jgi:hypothetical protein